MKKIANPPGIDPFVVQVFRKGSDVPLHYLTASFPTEDRVRDYLEYCLADAHVAKVYRITAQEIPAPTKKPPA